MLLSVVCVCVVSGNCHVCLLLTAVYSVADVRVDPTEAHYSVPRGSETVIALYDYAAQGPQELDLEEGVIIKVIGKEDSVWWCGQLKEKIGMFPAAYVEPYRPK